MHTDLLLSFELPPTAQFELEQFHRGDRATFESLYRAHSKRIDQLLGSFLTGVDRETVLQELFLKLLSSETLRRSFQGGNLEGWLSVLARNQALDFLRARDRTRTLHKQAARQDSPPPDASVASQEDLEAKELIETFRREHLPQSWVSVFEFRFLRQLSQEEASRALGLARTTLAYREARIRYRLKKFLLRRERGS